MLPAARQPVDIYFPIDTAGIVELFNFHFHYIEKVIQVQFPVWLNLVFVDHSFLIFDAHDTHPALPHLNIVLRQWFVLGGIGAEGPNEFTFHGSMLFLSISLLNQNDIRRLGAGAPLGDEPIIYSVFGTAVSSTPRASNTERKFSSDGSLLRAT